MLLVERRGPEPTSPKNPIVSSLLELLMNLSYLLLDVQALELRFSLGLPIVRYCHLLLLLLPCFFLGRQDLLASDRIEDVGPL